MKVAVFACLLLIIPFQAEASSCFGKRLRVMVTNGRNVGGGLLRPDPYVEVSVGDDMHKTKVIDSTHNPGWFQELDFPDVSSDMLKVAVWDHNAITPDENLGTCMVPLVHHGHHYQKVQCRMNNDDGVVHLYYRCM